MYVPSHAYTMSSLGTRLVAWLCLALVLLSGLTPAQGFVVCVEADGCITIEIKAPGGDCLSCGDHEKAGVVDESVSSRGSDPECPCVDYVVPGFPDEQAISTRSIDLQTGPWIASDCERHDDRPTPAPASERGPPPRVPRVAQSIEYIGTVILLL